MNGTDANRLAGGDPVLEPLMRAGDEGARLQEIELLTVTVARPLTSRILSRFMRSERILQQQDADDIASTVMLRLVAKLNDLGKSAEDAVDDFQNYVATLTYNAIYDFLRERFPQHTRLKNRLRYVLTHDSRLSLWSTPTGSACGLRDWAENQRVADSFTLSTENATPPMLDQGNPAAAVVAIFETIRRPLTLDALAELVGGLWGVRDSPMAKRQVLADRQPSPLVVAETREFLLSLWKEIHLLQPLQRKALLLNLRDGETINVLALFVLTGITKFDEVAAAISMTPVELAAVWNELPLDDSRIAQSLDLTRQQVINLRKSARERLARRLLSRKKRGG